MFKQALTTLVAACAFLGMAFTGKVSNPEKWKATLKLEGKGKEIVLVSDAVYGGYYPAEKKFFFFGKQHMFLNAESADMAKIYHDLCVTNASGKFQFEIENVVSDGAPSAPKIGQGNIAFKKKMPMSGTYQKGSKPGAKEVVVKGNLTQLGLVLTDEAKAVMTGKFTLTFSSTPN